MKKPKKITAAKLPSARAVSDAVPSRVPAPKARSVVEAKAPEKISRTVAAKKTKSKPVAETKPAAPPEAPAAKSKAKRAASAKAGADLKSPTPTTTSAKAVPEGRIRAATAAKGKVKAIAAPEPPAEVKKADPAASMMETKLPALQAANPAEPKAKVKRPGAKAASEPIPAAKAPTELPKAAAAVAEAKPKRRPAPRVKVKPVAAIPLNQPAAEQSAMAKATEETAPKAAEKPTSLASLLEPKRSAPPRKAPGKIPAILLEGDKPEPARASGPGQRYALGPKPAAEKLQTEGELPASYGTGAILLTARDPHWLYTHWDLSDDQQRRYNAFSRDGHLVVRICVDSAGGKPVAEIHVHPDSRHWFIHVERANTRYVAELGYYSAAEKWTSVSTSTATLTPPDAVSADTSAEFSTIPLEVPMQKLLSLVKEAVRENPPLAQALQELRAEGHVELPHIAPAQPATEAATPGRGMAWQQPPSQPRGAAPAHHRNGKRAPWKPAEWTPAQERALAEVISMDHVRRVWMGSLEITELIRRQIFQELAAAKAAELVPSAPGAPTSPSGAIGAEAAISSPSGKAAAQPGKGFWFNVNAELIVYGATEPDATVSIAGRKIKLRRDGSFSYRFALPDGQYEMPVVAVSGDQTDGRAADLQFSRRTEYRGDVGAHPQDPALRPLAAENF